MKVEFGRDDPWRLSSTSKFDKDATLAVFAQDVWCTEPRGLDDLQGGEQLRKQQSALVCGESTEGLLLLRRERSSAMPDSRPVSPSLS